MQIGAMVAPFEALVVSPAAHAGGDRVSVTSAPELTFHTHMLRERLWQASRRLHAVDPASLSLRSMR